MIRTLVAICVLLLASVASAQCPPGQLCQNPSQGWRPSIRPSIAPRVPRQVTATNPAIVRVGAQTSRFIDYGTGTIIERRGRQAIVLTAWHILSDGGPKAQVFVMVRGRRYEARVHHVDRLWDVAILGITDPGVEPIAMADTALARDESVSIAGFGSGAYRAASGKVTQFVSPGDGEPFEMPEVSAAARSGDSGGPMFNHRGQLAGVISASAGGLTVGCCLPRIRSILRAVLPPYPNRPGVIIPRPVVVAPTRPEVPVMQPPTIPPVPDGAVELTKRIAALEAKLDALTALIESREPGTGPTGDVGLQGPRGQAGPQGEPGPQGKTGGAGPTPAINIDTLIAALTPDQLAELAGKLPPIRVEVSVLDDAADGRPLLKEPVYNEAGVRIGTLVDRDDVHLGGVLPLTLISVPRSTE